MNKLTANISLYTITFFAAIQYVFLANIPATVSDFAFLAVTNLVGFVITFLVFFGELQRIDRKQVFQSFLLSLELLGFNIFLLMGTRGTSATVTAGVLSSYFVFIVLLSRIFFRERPEKHKLIAIFVVLLGVFLMMDADIMGLANLNILYLVISDVFFAAYLLTAERYSTSSNPSILAMGQTFFNFVVASACWLIESAVRGTELSLPADPKFWGSVFFISLFIRGLYGIVQIYAQCYVSPLNVALVFSTEIIMTMLLSPLLARLVGSRAEPITLLRLAGALIMMTGILLADPVVIERLRRRFLHAEK